MARDTSRKAPTRILLVEDNRQSAECLELIIGHWGYEVRVAHDGPEALELAKAFHPDVAIVDIGLPLMDGYEVAQRLRSDLALDGLTVIALTGHDPGDFTRGRDEAPFDHILQKPVQVEQLRRLLNRKVLRAIGPRP